MPPIEFTQNYQDLSTDVGFQFKFICERCGDGFMSTFDRNLLGTAGGAAHAAALEAAVEEIKPLFRKCRRCGNWLCEQTCWNAHAGMCKNCAPLAEDEETALRAASVEAPRFCEGCGKKLAPKAKFCGDCGAKVTA